MTQVHLFTNELNPASTDFVTGFKSTQGVGDEIKMTLANLTKGLDAATLKTLYEGNSNTNAFTDTEKTKLANIATSANNYAHPNHSGDVVSVADGAQTIQPGVVTLAKMADLAQNLIIGRITASTGVPEALTAANVRTIINVEDGATADQTGAEIKALYEAEADTNAYDDAAVAIVAAAIVDGDFSTNGFMKRTGAGTYTSAAAIDLTADVTGVLPVANYATGTPTGSKFVRDDGVLAVPPGSDEIADNLFRILGSVDATKKLAFEVDGLTTATTRTWIVPDQNLDLTPDTGDFLASEAGLLAIAGLAKTDSSLIVGNGTTWVLESGNTLRTSLGLAIGSDVQAYDAGLADIAGLATTANSFIMADGANWTLVSAATVLSTIGAQASDPQLDDIAALATTAGYFIQGNAAGTDFALSAFSLPTADGTNGYYLATNGAGVVSWTAPSGGGDALTSNPLSQFAATTSAQLAGVITDETGSGALVFATSPTLVTPNLGTPSALVLTNASGNLASGVTHNSRQIQSVRTNAGDPTSVVTPDFAGQACLDTTNDVMYFATDTTNTSWKAGGINSLTGTSAQIIVYDGSGVPTAVALSGDATISTAGALTIANSAVETAMIADDNVTYAKIQNVVANNVILGNIAGAGGVVAELTGTQVTALLDAFTSGLPGLAPASGGGTTNFLRADGTWAAPAGGGDALTTNPLSQFAATTSAQLAGVISDETGSGALVFATSPTLVTPALGTPSALVLTNATGLPTAGLVDDAVTYAKIQNVVANNVVLGNNAGAGGIVDELTGAEVTALLATFSTTTTTQGVVPGSNNVGATYYLDATGSWSVPAGGSGPSVTSGAAAPVSTPSALGDIYIQTTDKLMYNAVGTASSADWKLAGQDQYGPTDYSVATIVSGDAIMFGDASDSDNVKYTTAANFIADLNILDTGDIGVTVQGYDAGLAYLDGLNFTNEATFKSGVNLEIGVDVQAYDADTLKADTADVLTAGFATTPYNAGTKSTGTFTPDEANGNHQYAVNGGAHALAPPTNNCDLVIQYTNNASAGTITTTGFTKVDTTELTTTDGDDFFFYITKSNGFSLLVVKALQ